MWICDDVMVDETAREVCQDIQFSTVPLSVFAGIEISESYTSAKINCFLCYLSVTLERIKVLLFTLCLTQNCDRFVVPTQRNLGSVLC